MGQTLTHGVYLPDEGERNCYSGLAANWQILDSSVGTIAAHTAALAGKAPAVHTHTKADITDFPAYGNAAGTICEGNDSRLSDARTPVAHTHGKADVTDLLNSNFIPSANNSYDLGSSSYQWNNLYAKNYYYNGTQWGLNKNNTWTGGNIFSAETYNNHVLLTNTTLDLSNGNPALSETNQGIILFTDKNKWQGKTYARLQSWTASDQTITVLAATYRPDANTESDFSVWVSNRNNDTTFHPYGVPNPNLGNSTYKWKSFNGINPGALSLPTTVYSDIDTTDWTLTGSTINYTPVLDGWVEINLNANANSFTRISVENIYYRHSSESQAGNQAMLTFPVRANQTYGIKLWGSSILQARFIKCEGNV